MNNARRVIWFWQTVVSPHIAGLVAQLIQQGCDVTYVAANAVSEERLRQGWIQPDLGGARLEIINAKERVRELIGQAPLGSIHICQGIRGNGRIGEAVRQLMAHGHRLWFLMETVEDAGWRGRIKRLAYSGLFLKWSRRAEGFLAIGHRTADWIIAQGAPREKVFPFAYFLADVPVVSKAKGARKKRFRFVFVGRFIPLKRLDLLVTALATMRRTDVELAVIGTGPLEEEWRAKAEASLPGSVIWIGRLPVTEVLKEIAVADCLVLPSWHDGWGAVVSEALLTGTPVVCSSTCGSAGVVLASGSGGVFESGQIDQLVVELAKALAGGIVSDGNRAKLAAWARSLGGAAGAKYLREIFDFHEDGGTRPVAPWIVRDSQASVVCG